MAGRDFNYIKEKYSEAGARTEFEKICYSVICKQYPQNEVHRICPHPGDYGIDIFYGDFQVSICCFQCKFYLGSLSKTRRAAINKSFLTFVEQHQEIQEICWTLCLPDTLSHEDMRWWQGWKKRKEQDYHVNIVLYDGDYLLDRLHELGLYDRFFDNIDRNGFESIVKDIPPIVPSTNLFHYSYPNLPEIFGREEELQALADFLHADDSFSFWGVTGPAGVGKSKLVYYFSRQKALSDWRFVFVPKDLVKELARLRTCDISQNTCLIVDYANEISVELSTLLRFLSQLDAGRETKLRILLIAREGMKEVYYYENEYPIWFQEILKRSEYIITRLFKPEFLALTGIKAKDCKQLVDAYCNAFPNLSLSDSERTLILSYITTDLSDPLSKVEPLYVLFSVDAFLQEKKLNHWNKKELLKRVLLRNHDKWKQDITDKELLSALLDMLRYATIVGEWDPDKKVPRHLQQAAHTLCMLIERDPSNAIAGYFITLTGKCVFRDLHYILPSLSPDIVGEYFVLEYLNKLTVFSRDGWISFFATHFAACKDFFLRSIQNYGDDECFGHTIVKLFAQILAYIEREEAQDEPLFKMITSILGSYYSNLKGSSDPSIFNELIRLIDTYSELNQNRYQCWAELIAFRYRNTSYRLYHWRLDHFALVSSLYHNWPESTIIAREYVSYLGNLIEDSAGNASQIDDRTDVFLGQLNDFIDRQKEYRDETVTINTLVACIHVISAISQVESAKPLSTKYSQRIQEIIKDDYSRIELMICYIENADTLLLQLAKAGNRTEVKTTIENTKKYIVRCLHLDAYRCFWISLPIITQSIVNLCSYHFVKDAIELSHFFFQLLMKERYRELRDYSVFHHEESAIDRIFKSSFTPDSVREIFVNGSEPFEF